MNWELDTIRHCDLDEKHGFDLEVQGALGGRITFWHYLVKREAAA